MQPIAQHQKWRREVREILIVAILASAGIGLLTNAAFELLKSDILLVCLIGLALTLLSFSILLRLRAPSQATTLRLRGAISFDASPEKISPVRIVGYKFNDEFCEHLTALLAENAALKKRFLAYAGKKEVSLPNDQKPGFEFHKEIIESVVEFLLINELDLHLNSYFVENEVDTTKVREFGRNDLPKEVLSNKALDLFTKDYAERESFINENFDDSFGELYYATGENGAIYNRISIELPEDSTITRTKDGILRVCHPSFELSLEVEFKETSTYVDFELMDPVDFDRKPPYGFLVRVTTKVRSSIFRSAKEDDLYAWLDSYIATLQSLICIDTHSKKYDSQLRAFMASRPRSRKKKGGAQSL